MLVNRNWIVVVVAGRSTSKAWLATNQPLEKPGDRPVKAAPPSTSGGSETTGPAPGVNCGTAQPGAWTTAATLAGSDPDVAQTDAGSGRNTSPSRL
ncbi:MAG: hypothetical protein ACK6CT_00585 [Planctomycetia bacterium]|jgi:hypothetical protein